MDDILYNDANLVVATLDLIFIFLPNYLVSFLFIYNLVVLFHVLIKCAHVCPHESLQCFVKASVVGFFAHLHH